MNIRYPIYEGVYRILTYDISKAWEHTVYHSHLSKPIIPFLPFKILTDPRLLARGHNVTVCVTSFRDTMI